MHNHRYRATWCSKVGQLAGEPRPFLQSFTKYIETNASLRTILLSFVKKAIYYSRIGQNVNPPPPTKQC